jgi:WD40 repeat protein/serine/threonine protein kinase
MSQASVADLLEALRGGKLLEPWQQELLPPLPQQFDNPQALGRELVRRGWLTPFQVNQLIQGRGGSLLLGSYVLLEKLGEGGMGAVYKARNWKLGRIVALKVIRKERLNNETIIRRFRREIEAAAQLSHPNIAHAYDADEVAGTHFFVMEYVEGRDLAKVVKERGPLPIAEACEYTRQAALGLQHAHERGLVHRDIKPSNLLLSAVKGERTTIKLLDMGLARLERTTSEQSTTLTQEGAVMGTPDYIAPEQARDSHHADIRADLYSLGCTLYFLLTGKPPFPGGSLSEKLLKHQLREPQLVEEVRPEVPPGVAQLVRKLMAKRPEQRYQTPAELAEALETVHQSRTKRTATSDVTKVTEKDNAFTDIDLPAGETLAAGATSPDHPPSRRRRWPFVVLGIGGVAVLGAIVLALVLGRRSPSDDGDTKQTGPKLTAKEALESLAAKAGDPETTFADLATDVQLFKVDYPGTPEAIHAAELLMKLPSPLDELDPKRMPQDCIDYWKGLGKDPPRELVGVLGEHRRRSQVGVYSIALRPDGKELACGGEGDIDLLDPATGQILTQFQGHSPGTILSLAYSPTHAILVSTSQDRTAKMWDLTQSPPRCMHVFEDYANWVYGAAFDPTGNTLALSCADGTVQFWDLLGKKPRKAHELKLAGAAFYCAISPDGKLFGCGSGNGPKLWEIASGKPVEIALPDAGITARVAFGPNSKWMAVADSQTSIQIWDIDGRKCKERFRLKGHENRVERMDISKDGTHIVTVGFDSTIRLWNVSTKKGALLQYGWGAPCFSSSGKKVYASGVALRTWDVATGKEFDPLKGHTASLWSVAFSPDEKLLASASADHTAKLWDPIKGSELHTLKGPLGSVRRVVFSPDGKTLATAHDDALGTIKLWDAGTGRERRRLREHTDSVVAVAYSPDGKMLASASHDMTAKLWDVAMGRELRTLRGHTNHVYSVAFTPDGKLLATGGNDGTVRLWDAATGKEIRSLSGKSSLFVAFSPDGQTLASADYGGANAVTLWDVATGKISSSLTGHTGWVHSVAYSPNGKMIASSAKDGSVRIWDVQQGKAKFVFQLGPANSSVLQVVFAHDGRHVATANSNGTVYIFRIAEPPKGR